MILVLRVVPNCVLENFLGGIEVVLNFGVVLTYAAPLFVVIVVFAQFVKFWH